MIQDLIFINKGKIFMVTSYYRKFGGVETVMNNLCLGLNKLGYSTTISAFSFQGNPTIWYYNRHVIMQ